MRRKSRPDKAPAEQVVKDIRRTARRHFSAEDKIRIVLNAADGRLDLPHVCQRLNLLEFKHGVPALQIIRPATASRGRAAGYFVRALRAATM